jgi:hypothetical protein
MSALELYETSPENGTIRINRLPLLENRPRISCSEPPPQETDADLLSVFYNVAISTRNDFAHLDHPLSLADRESIFLRYADPRVAPFRHRGELRTGLGPLGDFLAPMNQVAIEATPEVESRSPYRILDPRDVPALARATGSDRRRSLEGFGSLDRLSLAPGRTASRSDRQRLRGARPLLDRARSELEPAITQ